HEPLNDTVALGLAHKCRARADPKPGELSLKLGSGVLRSPVMPEPKAQGYLGAKGSKVPTYTCSVPQFVGHSKRGGESLFPPELGGRFHPERRVWGHLVIVPEPAFELADHALCAPQLGRLHVVAPE